MKISILALRLFLLLANLFSLKAVGNLFSDTELSSVSPEIHSKN